MALNFCGSLFLRIDDFLYSFVYVEMYNTAIHTSCFCVADGCNKICMHNFAGGENFCENIFCGKYFGSIVEKPQTSQKLEPAKI